MSIPSTAWILLIQERLIKAILAEGFFERVPAQYTDISDRVSWPPASIPLFLSSYKARMRIKWFVYRDAAFVVMMESTPESAPWSYSRMKQHLLPIFVKRMQVNSSDRHRNSCRCVHRFGMSGRCWTVMRITLIYGSPSEDASCFWKFCLRCRKYCLGVERRPPTTRDFSRMHTPAAEAYRNQQR
jgi:hypothetical protein